MGAVIDYLSLVSIDERREFLRVMFLTDGHRLLADEIMNFGDTAEVAVYPRQIAVRALDLGATSLILVHNHPSGDPTPSRGDIEVTRKIQHACDGLGVRVLDHLVFAREGWTSLHQAGLI
ncbi:JAB domain-containing protein [Sphingomonas sp. dw_22]|uniref:JAB domain-containing protein n=1 Tax=Sphingomonas sp. dw_22 TaxID=2721175 RepID=UPI001BD26278|nr:JAB domain-containing protein [Sphingomonas sp. dw_22]